MYPFFTFSDVHLPLFTLKLTAAFDLPDHKLYKSNIIFTAWKVPVVGDFLVRIFPHSDWIPQPTITCSKLTVETLEKGVKCVQS